MKEPDGADNGESGAGIDAEQAGIGEGIARQGLHDGAGNCKGGADQQTEAGPRQAQVAHHSLRGVAGIG